MGCPGRSLAFRDKFDREIAVSETKARTAAAAMWIVWLCSRLALKGTRRGKQLAGAFTVCEPRKTLAPN